VKALEKVDLFAELLVIVTDPYSLSPLMQESS